MGRQGGLARFLGSWGDINGYADDGKAIWRGKSDLNKKKWLKMPSMEGQRRAAHVFSAASTVAGLIWSRLPVEMRRLADGGGFNRLVGQLRVLMEEGEGQGNFEGQGLPGAACSSLLGGKGQEARGKAGSGHWGGGREVELVDVDGLRGLDLSVDSSGPHRIVKSEQGKVKSGDGGDAHRLSYRLTGIRSLMEEIDLAVGDRAGKRSRKYVMADRLQPDVVREEVDYVKLGSMNGWFGERGARDKRQGASYLWADRDEVERIGRSGLLGLEPCKEWGGRYYGSRRFPLSYKGGELHRSEKSGWILRLDWLSIDTPDMPWATDANCVPFTGRMADGRAVAMLPGPAYASVLGGKEQVQRRVRVWVHAVELVTPVWDAVNERFGAPCQRQAHGGYITPWVVGEAGSWEDAYRVECERLQLPGAFEDPEGSGNCGSGVYVVFTAVEVSEKRGRHCSASASKGVRDGLRTSSPRHWVRLPWCSRLRVQEVVEVGEATVEATVEAEGRLVAVVGEGNGVRDGGCAPVGIRVDLDGVGEGDWVAVPGVNLGGGSVDDLLEGGFVGGGLESGGGIRAGP
jgi:hypothetical protein